MDCNIENIINGILEKLARGYEIAKAEWKADKRNAFKDGKFLGYYEAKETFMKVLDADDAIESVLEEIAILYSKAKEEWKADRKNPFKDGKFLACFEVLNMIPAV